ncbi:hypothetical protein ACS0TY_029743 [Phlomoides rotata]
MIAKKVLPGEEYPEYEGIEEAHYAYRVRDRLRKEVLVPLRRALQLPEEYLKKVKSGEAKITAGALLPHEINADLDGGEVAELQWKRMVDDMRKKGKLSNCLAIYDVSGSMHETPMEVSVALGVLVSERSEEPWKGKAITFSKNPELQMKVFDLILQVSINGKLKAEEMIKRLFVFSDMEFDQASQRPWETNYESIVQKFRANWYGECVSEIVF